MEFKILLHTIGLQRTSRGQQVDELVALEDAQNASGRTVEIQVTSHGIFYMKF